MAPTGVHFVQFVVASSSSRNPRSPCCGRCLELQATKSSSSPKLLGQAAGPLGWGARGCGEGGQSTSSFPLLCFGSGWPLVSHYSVSSSPWHPREQFSKKSRGQVSNKFHQLDTSWLCPRQQDLIGVGAGGAGCELCLSPGGSGAVLTFLTILCASS